MATAPSHIKGDKQLVTGPYTMTVADSVDGLLYMPKAASPRDLIVAAGNVLCGWPERKAKVGEKVSLVVRGSGPAIASGVIDAYGAVAVNTGGKCKAADVAADHVIGFNDGPATTTDGDIFTLLKLK